MGVIVIKKGVSLFISLLLMLPCFILTVNATDNSVSYPYKTSEVFVRDPAILNHDGLYYMYGTGIATAPGYGCRISPDLENWSEPYNVCIFSSDSDAAGDFWAPECHYYNGSFYLFATYRSKETGFRGTSVFKADSPLGPFEEISDGHITPHTSDNIDGTLYIDENGSPWMAYVSEWTSTEDNVGRMAVVRLSDDLSRTVSEAKEIFRADEPAWSASVVTDGPFLYKTSEGALLMLWSTVSHEGYCVGIARSDNGRIDGNWSHEFTRLYSKAFFADKSKAFDGGHPMLFRTNEGKLMMSIHSPNSTSGEGENRVFEHAVFYEIEEKNDSLRIKEFYCFNRFFDIITTVFNRISDFFEHIFRI